MITVKNLFEDETLLKSIVEDIEDIPEDTKVDYEAWVFRYNKDGTVSEFLHGIFDNPDEAIKYAKNFELIIPDGLPEEEKIYTHMTIEVETVIANPEDETGGTMNIGTIYHKDL